MHMTLTLNFDDPSEAALAFQAMADAFGKLKKAVADFVANKPSEPGADPSLPRPNSDGAAGTLPLDGRAAADADTKEFLADQPALPEPTAKRPRRTKAEMAAARSQEPNVVVADAANEPQHHVTAPKYPALETAVAAASPIGTVTVDQLRDAGNAFVKIKGAPALMQYLATFGATIKRYADVPQDKWAEVKAHFEAAVHG